MLNIELFNLALEENEDRWVQMTVKVGVMASMEISASVDDTDIPKKKINVIVSNEKARPVAWIQVSQFFDNGATQVVTHEGFIHADQNVLSVRSNGKSIIRGSLSSIKELSPDMEAHFDKIENGVLACCTSSGTKIKDGSACSITCCNASCSDSTCSGCSCSAM